MGSRNRVLVVFFLFIGNAQASLFFDDSFEGANPEASGWLYTSSVCNKSPCVYLDVSTDVASSGSKSLKGYYPDGALINPDGTWNQAIYRDFPATNDIYLRYYYRTFNFNYGPSAGTKHMYFQGSLPYVVSINWFGSREMSFATQYWADCGSCNLYPNMAKKPLVDNVWYCIEQHIKLNDVGSANGLVEMWVDGVQTVGYYDRKIIAKSDPFTSLKIYKQTGQGLMYYDQVAAATSRIGCGAAPLPQSPIPSPQLTKPAVPKNLKSK